MENGKFWILLLLSSHQQHRKLWYFISFITNYDFLDLEILFFIIDKYHLCTQFTQDQNIYLSRSICPLSGVQQWGCDFGFLFPGCCNFLSYYYSLFLLSFNTFGGGNIGEKLICAELVFFSSLVIYLCSILIDNPLYNIIIEQYYVYTV